MSHDAESIPFFLFRPPSSFAHDEGIGLDYLVMSTLSISSVSFILAPCPQRNDRTEPPSRGTPRLVNGPFVYISSALTLRPP